MRSLARYRESTAALPNFGPIWWASRTQAANLDLFDEFVRECELGLALDSVCDYLIEPGTPRPEIAVMERIQALYLSINLDDDCVDRLRKK